VPHWSDTSRERLATCNVKLQNLFNEVIKDFDCTVLCGYRTREEQEAAFEAGNSEKHYPFSKHNILASRAVDVAPYPIDWENQARFCLLAGWVMRTAQEFAIPITWGGDWNNNMCVSGEAVDWDLAHYELRG
jgi:hypothetical protein